VVPDTYLRDVIKKGLVKRIDHNKLSNIGNVAHLRHGPRFGEAGGA
jgi:spermidine/putrescine-binding protein